MVYLERPREKWGRGALELPQRIPVVIHKGCFVVQFLKKGESVRFQTPISQTCNKHHSNQKKFIFSILIVAVLNYFLHIQNKILT